MSLLPSVFGTQAIVARPTFQTRKLILETSFAIQDDFTDFDETRWAVREFKCHGLKQLFKLIASTAYACLVRTFYKHLTYDCNRPDILSSTINDVDIEVTTVDIAAALKCHVECPQSEEQWEACPFTLTIEEIVDDMCEERYADHYRNATSKAKLPLQLWLVDFVLQRNVCPLGHKTQRWDLFLTALYAFHKGYWCSILDIIWRQLHKF